MKKGTEYAGEGKPEVGVTPSDADFNRTRVGPASGVAEDAKPQDVVTKSDDDDEDDVEGGEGGEGMQPDEEGEEEEKARKSLTPEDLRKSLNRLVAMAEKNDAPSRKEHLLAKASIDTLSKSEQTELFEILGGVEAVAQPGDTLTKGLQENDTLQKALDVSEYLQEQHSELVKSLTSVGEEIQKSDNRRHEFNLVMAKAISDIGEMTKSLYERLDVLGGQPARAPKSMGVKHGQILQKSFAGQPPSDELNKSQILDGLDGLMQESMQKGMSGRIESGEDISIATSKYEQSHMISKPMLQAVKGFYTRKQAS
jgi:hypothetical protein